MTETTVVAGTRPADAAAGPDQVTADYTAADITVLEGLEPVRQRPGMFIGSTGPDGLHHLVYEVVDNAVDEAMAGHCSEIEVTLLADGGCRVVDDGRGIPTGPLPDYEDKSAVEVVLTVLHAGGKFDGAGYKVSGGLHGVGVSVVNALSSHLAVEVDRGGRRWRQEFRDGGTPDAPLADVGPSPDGRTGTTITFVPDAAIFEDSVSFEAPRLADRLQRMAFLNAGLRITFVDERSPDVEPLVFRYPGGIRDFVAYLNAGRKPLYDEVGYLERAGAKGEVAVAFQWNSGFSLDGIASFANGIATTEGGMHEQGFRAALTAAVNRYARDRGILKDSHDNLQGDDIREGLTAVVSVRLAVPQFEGQTKAKLGNTSMKKLVHTATYEQLGVWLEEHPDEGKAVVAKAVSARKARIAAQQVKNTIRKSALEGAGLPGKLTDCSSNDPDECELYIVEGDSAGGSAKDARDPETMAILPIRGKIINVERSRRDRIYANNEVRALISAIGAGVGTDFDVAKIRYGKVILLCDADVDGSHIRTLLLTFFYREMTELVRGRRVFIAQPPLYSTKVGAETHYLKDDAAKAEFLAARPKHRNEFTRLKGLGEMDFGELWDTTMDPDQRTLLRVTVDEAEAAHAMFTTLMGEDVDQRKRYINQHAGDGRMLDV
ncbi:MAG TPA: DNA topoisomerase IV subunit B [Acidimicrobiaceae bacterium]|nr:DNA topoisomerase IV subunit B [Acidimicrobiaceae bacterium]HCB37910.1 DNA topoisomerase IV subunit B [Acidimicrobiaceae bacterium]